MKNYLVLICCLAVISGCVKKEKRFGNGWVRTTNGPDMKSTFSGVAPGEQLFTIQATDSITVTTKEGTKFTISPKSFTNGQQTIIAGTLKVRVREYFTNADMVFGGVATTTNDNRLLGTGGSFYIEVTDASGAELILQKNMLVSVPSKGRYNAANRLFAGFAPAVLNPNGNFNSPIWSSDSNNMSAFLLPIDTSSYRFVINRLQWWNVDHYLYSNLPRKRISVKLPEGYGNENSMVAFVAPERALIAFRPDGSSQLYKTSVELPQGMSGKILCIARINDDIFYDLRNIGIAVDETIEIKSLSKISNDDMIKVIRENLE